MNEEDINTLVITTLIEFWKKILTEDTTILYPNGKPNVDNNFHFVEITNKKLFQLLKSKSIQLENIRKEIYQKKFRDTDYTIFQKKVIDLQNKVIQCLGEDKKTTFKVKIIKQPLYVWTVVEHFIEFIDQSSFKIIKECSAINLTTGQNLKPNEISPVTTGQNLKPNEISAVTTGQNLKPNEISPVTTGQNLKPNEISPVTTGQNLKPNEISAVTTGQNLKPNAISPVTTGQNLKPNAISPVTTGQNLKPSDNNTTSILFFINIVLVILNLLNNL